jgi:hypothetical protein
LELPLAGAFVDTGVEPTVVDEVWELETVEGVGSRAFLLGAIVRLIEGGSRGAIGTLVD